MYFKHFQQYCSQMTRAPTKSGGPLNGGGNAYGSLGGVEARIHFASNAIVIISN